MSNNSKGKAIADLLMSDEDRWWGWDEILEGLIPGFSNVPQRIQVEIFDAYDTYMTHARTEIDERGRMLMRDGKAWTARWKIATKNPEDRPYIDRVLADQKKRANGIEGRIEKRIENLKDSKILPQNYSPDKPALTE